MKVAALTSLIIAALGATSALAQSEPLTRDQVRAETARAVSSGDIERNDQNYGTEWATSPSSKNYDKHIANSMSSGGMDSTAMSSSSAMDAGSLGAAGRAYDGSASGAPASRADVAADRDSALRSDRWIFNDADGVQRLQPGWNSHAGRVYTGPADAY